MPADVDGDGKQEIITGSSCIDDNGKLLWGLNKGHGDAMHVGDLDPSNNGLEAWICHEDSPYGVSLVDCDTGKIIFHNGQRTFFHIHLTQKFAAFAVIRRRKLQ